MIPKIIKNEEEYRKVLARIEDLMGSDPNTPEGDELELLATLVDLYEKETCPIADGGGRRFKLYQELYMKKEWSINKDIIEQCYEMMAWHRLVLWQKIIQSEPKRAKSTGIQSELMDIVEQQQKEWNELICQSYANE